mgnify:CR=1 FL=1
MKIEILYPEVANLYGDLSNINYLASCDPSIEVVNTNLNDVPRFVNEDIALVYMGTTTESGQELIRDALKPYVNDLKKRIEDNKVILFTGNSIEMLSEYIEVEDKKIEMLGLYPFHAKRDMNKRYNSLWLGEFMDMKLVGFKSQFSHLYGDNSNNYLFKTIRGDGINLENKLEGIKDHNLYATYIIAPLLVNNPDFCKYILKTMGVNNPKLKCEEVAYESYNQRLHDFEEEKRNYRYS